MYIFKYSFIRVFSTLTFLFISVYLHAQLSRTHYIPPITAAQGQNATPQNQYLHISTPFEAVVKVEVNQLGIGSQLFSVSNSNPLEIFIGNGNNTSFILPSTNTASATNNKGYIIQSDKAVYASVRLSAGISQNQAGSLVSKGLSGLGKTFRVGTFDNQRPIGADDDLINFVSVGIIKLGSKFFNSLFKLSFSTFLSSVNSTSFLNG